MTKKLDIVVGLSGGVDSSVAAWLLQQKGHKVRAVFMKNWDSDKEDGDCSSKEDFLSAATAADKLNIPLEFVSFSKQYKDMVFKDFVNEYSVGRTPNPDIFCNSEIKFKAFLEHAKRLGADYLATGHYACSELNDCQYNLITASDKKKDQTYFLYRLNQMQLAQAMFPIGGLTKDAVREIATEIDLPNAQRSDSMGICFIGKKQFSSFISQFIDKKPGRICTENGECIGEHNGLHFYTIGQRKGIGIGGLKMASSGKTGLPWFVAEKKVDENTLVVVQGSDHPMLYKDVIEAKSLHWISGKAPPVGSQIKIKIRHSQSMADAVIDSCNDLLKVKVSRPLWGVAPGQSIVCYAGKICLGGGIIS